MSTYTIREPIGHTWQDELVWLPLEHAAAVQAVDCATGAKLPSQVVGQKLVVRVSLQPGQRLELKAVPCRTPSVPSPFTVCAGGPDVTEISNGTLAVRVPASAGFTAHAAPGPVLAMAHLVGVKPGNAPRWVGRGSWGDMVFMGRVETELLDCGPLLARWSTRYLVGGVELAHYELQLLAGTDFVQVTDRTKLGAGLAFRFELTGVDAPAEWFSFGGGEATDVRRGPIGQPPARKGCARPGEILHIDFHSGHTQMSYTWAGFLRPGLPAVGICELHGGQWQIPGRNRIRVMAQGDGLACVFAVNGGSKSFALVCGNPDDYAPAKGMSRFCELRRKHSDIPLEKVRHWVTEWTHAPVERPMLFPAGTADRWESRLTAWPELADAFRRLAGQASLSSAAVLPCYLVTGRAELRAQLLREIDAALQTGVDHVVKNGYLRLIIFDGRQLKVAVEALDVLRWRGEIAEEQTRTWARQLAFLAYCFADSDFWPWESVFRERDDPRSQGGEYWEDIGDAICPPNFATEYYTSFALVGLTYPEHPAAEMWIEQGCELFERNLATCFYESGGYCESLNYHHHEVQMLTQLATALWAAGRRDFFEHPRFRANFGFFADVLTPPTRLTETARELVARPTNLNPPTGDCAVLATNWGNSGESCSGSLLPPSVAVAAGVYADRDPAYARHLMASWRRTSQSFCTHYSGFNLIALGRSDLPDAELPMASKVVEGLGAVMRAAVGTPAEVFGWIKCGLATHHNCRDEGGLVLYARGAPLLGDFGYHTRHQGRTEGAYETWKHTCVSFGGRTASAYIGTERTLPPEAWRSSPESDLLVACLPVDSIVPEGASYLDVTPCPRIEHRRFILFVKPRYFVIYDRITRSTLPSSWWLHALAHDATVDGARVRFRGRFGVDLAVQMVLPFDACIGLGEYSVQRHLRVDQAGAGDYLAVITPLDPDQAAPQAQFDEATRVLTVRGSWGCDRIAIAAVPWEPTGDIAGAVRLLPAEH